MNISATVKSKYQQLKATVRTNDAVKEIQISPKPAGYGSSVNGGELLMLALATCYCNDIYREAAKRNITVSDVWVEASGEFGAEGEPGSNFRYQVHIVSDAPATEIDELVKHTDTVAEIHNTLRKTVSVVLVR